MTTAQRLTFDRDFSGDIDSLIEEFAAMSEGGPGVTRLAYTPLEREAHQRFSELMQEIGAHVRTDEAGNTIAELPGSDAGLPAIGTGSHLDSVPHGGRFDGVAGVVAALIAAREIVRANIAHSHPFRFVAFAAEEGARFGHPCNGSSLAAGQYSIEDLDQSTDAGGRSMADAMRSVGLDPRAAVQSPWEPAEWAAFVELHVEQGDVLERMNVPVGIVDLVSGSTRVALEMTGRASHTGGTPMRNRSDALVAGAKLVIAANTIASDNAHRGTRATVGRLDIEPGSITTIPGFVRVFLDVRDVDNDRQRSTADELVRIAQRFCDADSVAMTTRLLSDTSPVILPTSLRSLIAEAASVDGKYRVLTSGASHDSQRLARIMPVGMIFVPSRGGLSHVPDEYTSGAQIADGVRVLLRSICHIDSSLAAGKVRA